MNKNMNKLGAMLGILACLAGVPGMVSAGAGSHGPGTAVESTAPGDYAFPELGLSLHFQDSWQQERNSLLFLPVYGTRENPLCGLIVHYGVKDSMAKARVAAAGGQVDPGPVAWENSLPLFTVIVDPTGKAPRKTILEAAGGSKKEAKVEKMGEKDGKVYYFCTFPQAAREGKTVSPEYGRLCRDLGLARENLRLGK